MRIIGLFLFLLFGTLLAAQSQSVRAQSDSGVIEPTPPCNEAVDEASLCVIKKTTSWRRALNLNGPDASYRIFDAACEANDADGCWMYGRALEGDNHLGDTMRAIGTYIPEETDSKLGDMYIQKSCELGSEFGCMFHSINLSDEANWEPEGFEDGVFDRVMDDFIRACEQGFYTGCAGYYDLSMRLDVPRSFEEDKIASGKLCDIRIGQACHLIAVYLAGEASNDDEFALALPYWKDGCKAGFETACHAYADNMVYFERPDELDWAFTTACSFGFDPLDWSKDYDEPYPTCPETNVAE